MARKAILDTYYSFTPSTRTIVIPRAVPKERLVLITDLQTNQVIFNFSDPNLTATSYVVGPDTTGLYPSLTTTTIVLNYNTTGLTATDKLQIVIDEYDEKFSPSETYLDPINKLRTSNPQSLIDTDYEYSIQTTKWEQLSLINNLPFAYYTTATGNINVANILANTGSRSYSAWMVPGTNAPAVGNAVVILDSTFAGGDGLYIVDANNNLTNSNATNAANNFSYTGKFFYTGPTSNTTIFNPGTTIGYAGYIFSNSSIAIASASATSNVVTIQTVQPHGLCIGNEIALTGASAANGSYTVSTVINPTVFQFNTYGFSTQNGGAITGGNLYVRPQGLALHRPADGGVRFSTNAASHNQQYIRQTRRYFRYQSGKGIQMSTGTVLRTQLNIDGITNGGSNTVCYVTTKDPHNIVYGVSVSIAQANESAYNGSFGIVNVINPYQFSYLANSIPTNPVASGPVYGTISNWYGAAVQVGIFDQQNGLYWKYDGQALSITRRSSVYQLAGQIQVTPGSSAVTASVGYPTYFNKQLAVNDYVVIKGMSYRVINILSDQSIQIQPPYRGTIPQTNALISKTIDYTIPQSQFNIDRLDGTGPSGYIVDLTRMQMLYIDYSWYGAGFIRFGIRGASGDVIYCHRILNNNQNFLAYMRSGNLPGRYEVNSFSKTTFLTGGGLLGNWNPVTPIDTTIYANTTSGFPSTGTIWVRTANNGGLGNAASEFINYNGITANSFLNCTRANLVAPLITSGNFTSGNSFITTLGNSTGVQIGQYVVGNNLPSQAFVIGIPNPTTVILSQAPYASGTGQTITFLPASNTAQSFIFSTTAQTAIELHSPQFGPEINHWGTSAIMDGGFTPDKSFIFTKGMQNTINVASGATQAIMSFRIAPSASNGVPGATLGVREVINRMQHLPFETDIYSNGSFLITVFLNSTTSNTLEQWTNVGGSSLSQYVFHNQGTQVVPNTGEAVFGFYLNTQGSAGLYATTQQDLSQLLAIGHSILGGGSANAGVSIYPNGPDVLTFSAQSIQTGANAATIQARYSWQEAQA